MLCQDKFTDIYKRIPESLAFCPYRVCPIGAHSDHNIDKGIHIAFRPKKNGVIEMVSLQFPKRAQWHIHEVPPTKQNDWADYLRGCTLILGEKYPLSRGLSGVIEGTLPIGGLSSSAAVALVFLKALCDVNNLQISPLEMIMISVEVENKYVGVNSGKLDQSCEVFSRKNKLLYLDTQNNQYELIPFNSDNSTELPFKIAIFFSGVERTLAGSKFNMRVDELRSAAYALKAYAGMDYGKFQETNMRDIPADIYNDEIAGRFPYVQTDTFMAFHCGNTAACMVKQPEMKFQRIMKRNLEPDGEPNISRGTIEGDIKDGDITFFRIQSTADAKLRGYVAQGEVLPVATRSFGSIGIFAIDEMGRFYRHVLIQKNFPHHGAVAFGHYGREIYEVFKYLGMDDIGFNQPKGMLYKTENPFG